MLHALYFSKTGHGNWTVSYNNRFVQSETFNLEKDRSKPAFLPAVEGDSPAIVSALLLNLVRKVTVTVVYRETFDLHMNFLRYSQNCKSWWSSEFLPLFSVSVVEIWHGRQIS